MTITEAQDAMQTELASKESLRGAVIVTVDYMDILNTVNRALTAVGVAIVVGTSAGETPAPNQPNPNFTSTMEVTIMENVALHRNRFLAATVANQAARLALSSAAVQIGQKVRQSDVAKDYWLFQGTPGSAANWGEVLTATQMLELVLRSLHFWHPSPSNTFVAQGYEVQEDENDFVFRIAATFATRLLLPNDPVT